ncbi:YeeE/YedE thiosulfate transporter family protein [Marinoscillum sp.]|uniref:YeeE/YedE thiosulfate transporter family protein n=1 Tax=Marinoscillum sp. TaxID=2024838 RepID=UPI003BA9FF19
MNGPFLAYGWIGEEASLMFALAIGLAFGFFLERAGLGSAQKLTGQFYFRDLTVFKMMFTAIITAMLGVFWLHWLGMLQADLIYLTPTYIWPQLIGGLIFGVGFIVGGYCPGTSCVASSTGSLDGMWNVMGLLSGIFLFGELYPYLEPFYMSGSMGQITLWQELRLPMGISAAIITLIALLAFWGAELLEKKNATK